MFLYSGSISVSSRIFGLVLIHFSGSNPRVALKMVCCLALSVFSARATPTIILCTRLTRFRYCFHLVSHHLPSLTKPTPATSSTPFVRQSITLVISVAVFGSGYAFCDVLFSGMAFDFAELLVSSTSSLDGYPRLLPEISIDL